MKNQSENELLSAYLDGELTAAEQTRVEQVLAESPAARQLLDELRALSSTLKSLPRQELGEDLSTRVLQDAAQRKLGGIDVSQPASQLPQSSSIGQQLRRQIVERIKNNPRMIVWPAIVATVAVLLMVFNPDRPGGNAHRPIARVPADNNAENEDRAVGATLVEPKPGEVVNTEDQPSIRAVGAPPTVPSASQLVMKGTPSGGETPNPPLANSRAGLMVVECQMSRESLEQQDYRKIFEANNIALPDKSAGETFATTPAELAAATGIDRAVLEDNPNTANADVKAKVFAVEITPLQLAGLLNSMNATPGTFREVSVKTAQLPQPAISAAPPPPAAQTPQTKRVLFVFRVVDP